METSALAVIGGIITIVIFFLKRFSVKEAEKDKLKKEAKDAIESNSLSRINALLDKLR
jgi:uncharacterized membrane protein YvbJ